MISRQKFFAKSSKHTLASAETRGRGAPGTFAGLSKSWLPAALLLLLAGSSQMAFSQGEPDKEGSVVAGGLVIQARPWRAPDRRVTVDYTVRFEGGKVTPGTLLAAYRQTPLGRQEGPPLARVGWLRVIAADEELAIARAIPGARPEGPSPGNPVVQVGDQVWRESKLGFLGRSVGELRLDRLFPNGDAELAPDFRSQVGDLAKSAGQASGQLLVIVHGPGSEDPADGQADLAFEQAQLLAREISEFSGIAPTKVHALILPSEGQVARVEMRVFPHRDNGALMQRPGVP